MQILKGKKKFESINSILLRKNGKIYKLWGLAKEFFLFSPHLWVPTMRRVLIPNFSLSNATWGLDTYTWELNNRTRMVTLTFTVTRLQVFCCFFLGFWVTKVFTSIKDCIPQWTFTWLPRINSKYCTWDLMNINSRKLMNWTDWWTQCTLWKEISIWTLDFITERLIQVFKILTCRAA